MKYKLIVVFILIVFVFAWAILHFRDGQIMRRVSVIEGESILKSSYKDYLEHGYVTNYNNSNYQVWLATNPSVIIDGTQYQYFIAARVGRIYGTSAIAMTTNQMFIWLDSKRPPKIIETDYIPQFFPPRF